VRKIAESCSALGANGEQPLVLTRRALRRANGQERQGGGATHGPARNKMKNPVFFKHHPLSPYCAYRYVLACELAIFAKFLRVGGLEHCLTTLTTLTAAEH
jgi:hypothetical protein